MTPRRPHLRNRKRIKAPTRFEDAEYNNTPSPRQESHEESEESSELEEEIYKSPKPKKPKSKPRAYIGEVTEFNPNLPPAAFPTLDHPDYVHNGGHIAIDLDSHLSGLQGRESDLVGSETINSDFLGRRDYHDEVDVPGHLPTVMRKSNTVQEGPRDSMPSSIYGESTDNGPRNPIWASNMARMEEAGRMSDLDRNMLEMETSEEENSSCEENAAVRPTKLARSASVPELPVWDDLTVAHKLDLTDAIAELFPDPAQYMHQLRLSLSQKKELVELLIQRKNREAREEANQQSLQEQTNDVLLQGRPLSQPTFHKMVDENLYGAIHENDRLQTNLKELKKARAYLKHCGINPALADSSWDVPSITNAASGSRPRYAQSQPKASGSGTTAQPPSSPSEGPYWRRPALSTPFQQAPYPPDPRLELMQQHTPKALPQHRPTVTHTLIAQHSPAAPLSKVPVQSYRVAPGNQNGDLRARYQAFARTLHSTLPAFPEQPDPSPSSELRAINNAYFKAHNLSSGLPPSPGDQSLHVESHSLAANGLRKNQASQSSGVLNLGVSAPQEYGGFVGNGDLVNKKKRKKMAT